MVGILGTDSGCGQQLFSEGTLACCNSIIHCYQLNIGRYLHLLLHHLNKSLTTSLSLFLSFPSSPNNSSLRPKQLAPHFPGPLLEVVIVAPQRSPVERLLTTTGTAVTTALSSTASASGSPSVRWRSSSHLTQFPGKRI